MCFLWSLILFVIWNSVNFHSSHIRDGNHDVHLLLRVCGHLPGPHLQVGQLPCRDRRTRPLMPSNKDDNCNFLFNRQLSAHSTKERGALGHGFTHQFLDDKVVNKVFRRCIFETCYIVKNILSSWAGKCKMAKSFFEDPVCKCSTYKNAGYNFKPTLLFNSNEYVRNHKIARVCFFLIKLRTLVAKILIVSVILSMLIMN